MGKRSKAVDEYIAAAPGETQANLKRLREAIRKAAPEAEEKIGYGMVAFSLDGALVYFGIWKTHIGFYPASLAAVKAYSKELGDYPTSKGTIRFPLDKPVPVALVGKIVAFRLKENRARKNRKTVKRKPRS
jgi:uncharacterized protein YdhG (YjbR/CyaY superfamily)